MASITTLLVTASSRAVTAFSTRSVAPKRAAMVSKVFAPTWSPNHNFDACILNQPLAPEIHLLLSQINMRCRNKQILLLYDATTSL